MSWRARCVLGLALIAAWLPSPAEAQCTISASPVVFGSYDVFAPSAVESTGDVTYSCGIGLLLTITLSKGSSSTFTPRTMTNGVSTLSYNLFRDAGRSIVWGDGTGGTQTYFILLALAGGAKLTVYGRIPALQDVAVGPYTDTVVATIIF